MVMTHTHVEIKVNGQSFEKTRVETNGETDTTEFITSLVDTVGESPTQPCR